MSWTIKRPNGITYSRKNLDGLEAAYGSNKEGLEKQGWTFSKPKALKNKDTTNADD